MILNLGKRFSSYQLARISMNVTRGCDCTYDTINMELTFTSLPTNSYPGTEEAFRMNSTGPQNVDPSVVSDLWPWFRG